MRVFEGEDGQEVVQVVDGCHVGEVDAGKELILEPVPAVGHDELELVQKLLLVDRVGLWKKCAQFNRTRRTPLPMYEDLNKEAKLCTLSLTAQFLLPDAR